MRIVYSLLLLSYLAACCVFSFAAEKVASTTVSDLTLYPKRFDGTLVRVNALLVFGEQGDRFLLDPNPADSALLTLRARVWFHCKSSSRDSVCGAIRPAAGRVFATFTGHFRYAPWNPPNARPGSFLFDAIDVSALRPWAGFGVYPLSLTPQFPTDLNDLQIRIVHTACYGSCPDYSVTILGDGAVTYDGRGFVKLYGKVQKTIGPDAVRDLVHRFFEVGYFSMMSGYGNCDGDVPSTSIAIDWPGGHKTINSCGGTIASLVPSSLLELENAIESTAGSDELAGTISLN